MKIAILCSNNIPINEHTKKGTEIFNHILIKHLAEKAVENDLELTAFASGDSSLPIKIESINPFSTSYHNNTPNEKIIMFELALLSKAFSLQEQFDLYHVNIGDGDIAMPFSPFIRRPILITIHYTHNKEYTESYFSLFNERKNVFFITVSKFQKSLLPASINHLATIYHGIDTKNFTFNETGGEDMMWAGRTVPEKGISIVAEVARTTKRGAKLFGIYRKEHKEWLERNVVEKINATGLVVPIHLEFGLDRLQLIKHFQKSKLFLFPVTYEESFGLVLAEAMSCGTPVVAYAKGSIPEIVKDGVTGFIVNSSDNDIRGDWIIKKTGIEGLIEAVERIYNMPENEYLEMRRACRQHVEENFTIEKMTENYIQAYKKTIELYNAKKS